MIAEQPATAEEAATEEEPVERTTIADQAQQDEVAKPEPISVTPAGVSVPEAAEAPKTTEPAIQVSSLKTKSPAASKSNNRPHLPLQSCPNGAQAKAKPVTKAASPQPTRRESPSKIPTATILHSKREAPGRGTPMRASKRAKPAGTDVELDPVAPAAAEQKENVPPVPARPNSLDELLEEQARRREKTGAEGGWRPA